MMVYYIIKIYNERRRLEKESASEQGQLSVATMYDLNGNSFSLIAAECYDELPRLAEQREGDESEGSSGELCYR